MKTEVENIIKSHLNSIDANEFSSVFEMALMDGVAMNMLDNFFEADISVPTEQLREVLKKNYIDDNPTLSPKEKHEKAMFIQYLINRYQISIFESVMKSK